jgi:hypothetical protein
LIYRRMNYAIASGYYKEYGRSTPLSPGTHDALYGEIQRSRDTSRVSKSVFVC